MARRYGGETEIRDRGVVICYVPTDRFAEWAKMNCPQWPGWRATIRRSDIYALCGIASRITEAGETWLSMNEGRFKRPPPGGKRGRKSGQFDATAPRLAIAAAVVRHWRRTQEPIQGAGAPTPELAELARQLGRSPSYVLKCYKQFGRLFWDDGDPELGREPERRPSTEYRHKLRRMGIGRRYRTRRTT